MSKKNRAQHNAPRRHGDRNVQTRYSKKHQCGEAATRNQDASGCCDGGCAMADGASREVKKVEMGCPLVFIPEIKIKIGELHLHQDEHMETFNFNSGSMATVLHGAGDTEVEEEFEEEDGYGEEN